MPVHSSTLYATFISEVGTAYVHWYRTHRERPASSLSRGPAGFIHSLCLTDPRTENPTVSGVQRDRGLLAKLMKDGHIRQNVLSRSVSTYNDYLKGQQDQKVSAAMSSTSVPCLEPNDTPSSIKQISVEHLHRGEQKQV